MDILRELSESELDFIIEKLKYHLLYSIKDLYYILSARKCRKSGIKNISDKILPTFYTHRNGIKEHCTIFGITSERDYIVWYFTFEESLNEIRECLENTKLIKWESPLLFLTIHTEQIQPILDFAVKNDIKIEENKENSYIYLPIEEALKFNIEVPSDTVLVPLKEEDAPLCNNLWAFKSENSEVWVKNQILVNGGYSLRDKTTNELLSFGMVNDQLAIGLLTTIEKAQRRGYAEIIVKQLSKMIAEDGFMPTAYVANPVAYHLFNKLGFKRIGASNWIYINGKTNKGKSTDVE